MVATVTKNLCNATYSHLELLPNWWILYRLSAREFVQRLFGVWRVGKLVQESNKTFQKSTICDEGVHT